MAAATKSGEYVNFVTPCSEMKTGAKDQAPGLLATVREKTNS